jgi:alpha-tubulin suppressor-like RCC1 family protein
MVRSESRAVSIVALLALGLCACSGSALPVRRDGASPGADRGDLPGPDLARDLPTPADAGAPLAFDARPTDAPATDTRAALDTREVAAPVDLRILDAAPEAAPVVDAPVALDLAPRDLPPAPDSARDLPAAPDTASPDAAVPPDAPVVPPDAPATPDAAPDAADLPAPDAAPDLPDAAPPDVALPADTAPDQPPGPVVVDVSAGHSHTCAVLSTGAVRCWGLGTHGRLGSAGTASLGDDETPASVDPVQTGVVATAVAAGTTHSCVLSSALKVRCWGLGGRLGYGNDTQIGDDEAPSTAGDVPIGGDVLQLAAGGNHTCARLASGSARCWGFGANAALGYPGTPGTPLEDIGDDETPADAGDIDIGAPISHIAPGLAHTCALLTTGKVRCWGFGGLGRLGYGNTFAIGDDESPASAGDVDIGGKVVQLAAGWYHNCALLETGGVRCWGAGNRGLGYGNLDNVGDDEAPAAAGDVGVVGTVVQLAAGGEHTCALLDTGTVRCWGWSQYGALGYGNEDPILAASAAGEVPLGGRAVKISAGFSHTCAVLEGGTLRCWGRGTDGRLGYGNDRDIGDDETPASAGDVPVL